MAQDNKNKQSRDGAAPSFKIPTAAKLACMGLLSGASALPTVASAGSPVYPVTVVDDHYVTPTNTPLQDNGTSVKSLISNDTYRTYQNNTFSNVTFSSMSTCPDDFQVFLAVPPQHGNVSISHTACISGESFGTPGNAFGSFLYTPDAGFTGVDSFQYGIQDDYGDKTSNATATILVGQQFTAAGGALGAALLIPLAAAGLARRRKKPGSDQ